jgi:hypothetical protein
MDCLLGIHNNGSGEALAIRMVDLQTYGTRSHDQSVFWSDVMEYQSERGASPSLWARPDELERQTYRKAQRCYLGVRVNLCILLPFGFSRF